MDFAAAVSTSSVPSLTASTLSTTGTLAPPPATIVSISTSLQTILATPHIPTWLKLTFTLFSLKSELINAQLQAKLSRDVDSNIAEYQRQYYLTEQLQALTKVAGSESSKERMPKVFRERVEGKPVLGPAIRHPVAEKCEYDKANEQGQEVKVNGVREKRESRLIRPAAVRKVGKDEMKRLGMLNAVGSEDRVVMGYLE